MNTIEHKKIGTLWLCLISDGKTEKICKKTAPILNMHDRTPGMSEDSECIRYLFRTSDQFNQQWKGNHVLAKSDKLTMRETNSCIHSGFFPNIWWNGGGNVA